MPRNNGIYSPPPGTGGIPQTTISSAMFNAFVADITADQNNPRPIIAGGTGSATSQGAIDAFFGAPRTIVDERLLFVDPVDPTKRVRLDAGNITAGQTRVVSVPDSNVDLGDISTISTKLPLAGGTMTGRLTLVPADDDPDGTASLNIPAGADVPDVQVDGDLWADSNEDLRYRRGGVDAAVYDTVNLPRPAPGEMATGTETEPRAVSAADVGEAVSARALGVGQTWQNVSGSRAFGTNYQNTTGKPILVAIRANMSVAGSLEVSPDGVAGWVTVGAIPTNSPYPNAYAIIPPGHYYRATGTVTNIIIWSELR